MPRVFYCKKGTTLSGYPAWSGGMVSALNDIVISNSNLFKCNQPGTSGGVSLNRNGSYPSTATSTGGTDGWDIITGLDGHVANTWNIAIADVDSFLSSGVGFQVNNQDIKDWHAYDRSGYPQGSTFYMSYLDTLTGAFLASTNMNKQWTNINYTVTGLSPEQYQIPYPAAVFPVRFISADPATYPAVARKGLVVNLPSDAFFELGPTYAEYFGIIFNMPGTQLTIGSDAYEWAWWNTRSAQFYSCDFNFQNTTTGPINLTGIRIDKGTLPAGFHQCTFNMDQASAVMELAGGASFTECTFASAFGVMPPSGFLSLSSGLMASRASNSYWNNSGGDQGTPTGDREVEFIGCTFSTPIRRMFYVADTPGSAKLTFRGCTFPAGTDLVAVSHAGMSYGSSLKLFAEYIGCSTVSSYTLVTAHASAVKTNNVYRAGSIPDAYGNYYSYYLKSRRSGLVVGEVMDELQHIVTELPGGLYECCLYLCVPPTQLLSSGDIWIMAIPPDSGADDLSTIPSTYNTEKVANTVSSYEWGATPTELPIVSATWSGTPVGWVTQVVRVVINSPATGRVYVIPFIARANIEAIMCPSIGFHSLG